MIDYNDKVFAAISNSENGAVETGMQFHYQQEGQIISCNYHGANIQSGHLIALVDSAGILDMRYHQVHTDGNIRTGICTSTPEFLSDGRIRLHEKWKWTSGDFSEGESILEEQK